MLNQILHLVKKEGDSKVFNYNGYLVNIIRQQELGHLCGYIQIPKDHPIYRKELDEIKAIIPEPIPAHGGLNFSRYNPEDGLFWIGFDCGHADDLSPYLERLLVRGNPERFTITPNRRYRTMEYVSENLMDVVDVIDKYRNVKE